MSDYTLWDGEYDKRFYAVLIKDKPVFCWPNAGEMNALDGSGKHWKPEDQVMVREALHDEVYPRKKAALEAGK